MVQDCPNGKLTPNTFCEMYKMFFPAGDADKFCENVFRTFDADKSGTIDFKVGKCYESESGWFSKDIFRKSFVKSIWLTMSHNGRYSFG